MAKKRTRGVSAGLAEEILLEGLLLLHWAEDALVEVLNKVKIEEQEIIWAKYKPELVEPRHVYEEVLG